MKYICNYLCLKGIKNNENMFPFCQTYKPTGARGLTSRRSSLANEVNIGHRESLVYATKTIDFHTDNIITYMQDIALVF